MLLDIRQTGGLTFTVADGAATIDLLVNSSIYNNGSYTTAPLIKAGAGRMTLTGSNGVTANTNINAGILQLTGTAKLYGAAYSGSTLTVAAGATLEVDSFGYDTNGGLGQLRVEGASKVLNGGSITVLGNTQAVGNNFQVANASSGTFTMATAGQTLTLDGNGNDNIKIGGPLTFGGAGNILVNEVIENNGGAGSIVKADAGTLTFNGTMTYTGSTTVSSGTFVLGGAGQLGSGNYAGAVTNNATFILSTGATQTFAGAVANAGSMSIASAANQTFSGVVSGAGSVTKSGAGTLTLSNDGNTFSGGLTLSAGTLAFASGGLGSGTVAMGAGSALRWNGGNTQDVSSQLALPGSGTATFDVGSNDVALANALGAGSAAAVVKTGAGTLMLTGANDYTGGTQVTAGTLAFATSGLGSTGNVSLADATALRWASGNTQDISSRLVLPESGAATLDVGTNDVTLASGFGSGVGGGLTKAGAGTLILSGSNGYTGATTISEGTLALAGAGTIASSGFLSIAGGSILDVAGASGTVTVGELDGAGNVALGGNTLRSVVSDVNGVSFSGVISGSGGFTKAGAGTLTLEAPQAFTGAATVAEGVLAITSGSLFASASRINVAANATLESVIEPLTVIDGQTLGGYGEVVGDVMLELGAFISPGGSVGTLTVGGLTFSGSAGEIFEITNANPDAGAGTGWDLIEAASLTITATPENPFRIVMRSLTSGTDQAPGPMAPGNWNETFDYRWLFVDTDAAIDSFDSGWFTFDFTDFEDGVPPPGTFSVVLGDNPAVTGGDDTELWIVYAAVPEPGTLALAGIGLAAAAWAARRRRRKSPSGGIGRDG